jgi:hypothetical protein
MKMEFNSIADDKKNIVMERLKGLNNIERIMLLDRYAQRTENIYCIFRTDQKIDIITRIFTLKFNNDALVDTYVNGDPIVDVPGCRLSDFLDNEFLH